MSAVVDQIEAGKYYELRSNLFFFEGLDVEGLDKTFKKITLKRGEIVLCTHLVHRKNGNQGRGRYARLLMRSDGGEWTLFLRISRFDRPGGQWAEMNPMIVLAMADRLPMLPAS